jgi:hypothetical protein
MPISNINNGESASSVRTKLNGLIAQSNGDNATIAMHTGQIATLQSNDATQDADILALQNNDSTQNANIIALQLHDTTQDAAILALQNASKKDFREALVGSSFGTSSTLWTDVPGMTLTSGNLGANGTYKVMASFVHFSSSTGGSGKQFRLVYGVADTQIGLVKQLPNTTSSESCELIAKIAGIPAGTVFKLQMRRVAGGPVVTTTILNATMHIEGVLDSNIIP